MGKGWDGHGLGSTTPTSHYQHHGTGLDKNVTDTFFFPALSSNQTRILEQPKQKTIAFRMPTHYDWKKAF